MDLLGVDAELLSQSILEPGYVLAALPHRQVAVGPGAAGGEQLDRVVVLGRRGIMLINRHRRTGEGGLGVADLRVLVIARHVLRSDGRRPGAVEAGRGLFRDIG